MMRLAASARTWAKSMARVAPLKRQISRRRLFLALACLLLARGALAQENVLNIYNWSDYIGETTIADFERETGIKVHYDTFDSNETLHAKLLAGRSGYDIVVPSANWAKLQIDGGLLLPIDKSKIPNYQNLDPYLMGQIGKMDPGNQYLLPWLWGITTVGINVAKVKTALGGLPMPANAWDLFFKPEYISRLKGCGVSVLDSGDEIFPAALRYLNLPAYSQNPADYEAAAKLLASIQPYISVFSSSGYINDLAAGALCLSVGWNGDIGIAAQRAKEAGNGQDIEILIPRSGALLFFDTMAIPVDAQHVAQAYQWINFIYRPNVQAGIVNKVRYPNPVRAADPMVNPDLRNNPALFLSADELTRMQAVEPVSNRIRRLRTRLFTRFKTGL